MGQYFSTTRKRNVKGQGYPTCSLNFDVSIWGDGVDYSNDITDGIMLSLKKVAHVRNLDHFVNVCGSNHL